MENDELLDENNKYMQDTADKEYKIEHLRWELHTIVVYFGVVLAVVITVTIIIAHILGFGCLKDCIDKCNRNPARAQFNYSLAAADDEDTNDAAGLL